MRFAFVVPRYGAEIAAGAEHACRLLAEQVSHRHDVDVLTTCARDARTWKNEYAEGTDRVRGVIVRRFPVGQRADEAALEQLTRRLLSAPRSRAEEHAWVRQLGPVSPALLEYLKRQHRSYDVLVFFSLQHATTADGARIAPERSVIFPFLELQPTLRFSLWADILSAVRGIAFTSNAERRLLHEYVGIAGHAEEVVGIGIEGTPQLAYPRHQQDPADVVAEDDMASESAGTAEPSYLSARGITFRRRHRLYGSFALYGGRVEPDNGCEEMLGYFSSYASEEAALPLVLLGVKMMKVPDQPHLRLAGVLPERERMAAYEAADVTIAPSPDDLMAQATLESFAVGTPVLASARNLAAVEHCREANGGLFYATREEFVEALRMLAGNARLRDALGHNGRNYVRQQYRWDHVLGRFERLVARVRGR
jgi:glycosyltransferase involved in cell wall biosynthesis